MSSVAISWLTKTILALGLIAGFCATANAQGFRGGGPPGGGFPSPEDSFRRMDRNQNGQIDPDELGFMRDMYSRAGLDVSRPISQQEFIQGSQKIREQFEQARSSGDFSQFRRPESSSSSPPPSFPSRSDSDRGDSRRSEEPSREERRDDRDRDRDRDRGRDERRDSSPSGKFSKKPTKAKARITQDLPADYRLKDSNGDGQIGLYEWDRKAFAQFFSLDRNGDGLLTPEELIAATKKSATSDKPSSKAGEAVVTTPSAVVPIASPSTSDAAKPSDSSATKSATSSASTESSPGVKSFVSLDYNHDGKLSEEEFRRSRTTRGKFERANIELKFPVEQAQFVELFNKAEAQ